MLNKNIFTNVSSPLSVFFVFALVLGAFIFNTNDVYAATCTATTGNWNAPGTWSNCNDDIPTAGDDVVIPTGVIVTVDTAGAVANTLSVQAAATANGVLITSPGTLVVSGAATIAAATETANSFINVGSAGAAFTADSLTITGSDTVDENSVLIVHTGTVTITGNVTFAGTAAQAQFTSTGASSINIGGHFGSGGTFTRGTSTVTFNGSGAQNVGAYSYYNVTINKSAGTATLLGNSLMLGNLLISSGTFTTSTHTLDITGSTTISSGATLTHGTGAKVHNGNVVIDEGGTWLETGPATVTFLGHVTNNGTFTASTGVHTFSNFTRTINGTLSIPNVNFNTNAIYTNTGTLTISTALTGDGVLINGAGATLNIGDDEVDDAGEGLTLTASATGNTVNYNRAGAQIVKPVNYYNLTLSGSGAKTYAGARAVGYDLVIGSGVTANLDDTITVSGGLKLGGSWKSASSWGFTGSTATHINTTFFSTGTGKIVNALSHHSTVITSNGDESPALTPDDDEDVTKEDEEVTPETPANDFAGCGNRTTGFSTSTGMSCVGNTAGAPANDYAGCGNKNTGFSTATGKSCVGNTVSSAPQGNAYAFGTALVKQGSTGEACRAWQMFLNAKASAGLSVDGMCGPMTMNAAKAWQASAGLTADGLLGPASRAKAMMQ